MKQYISLLFGTLVSMVVFAQKPIDRSKPPKPGNAPVISFKDPAIFTLPNGITVLVVENHKLPKVTARLNIDRGPVLEADKAGTRFRISPAFEVMMIRAVITAECSGFVRPVVQ